MLDGAGRVSYLNRAAEEMYGYRREEVLGRVFHEVFVTEGARAHYEKLLARPALGAEVRGRGLPGFVSRGYGAHRRLRGTTLGELLAAVNTA